MFEGDERHVQVTIRHVRPKDKEMWERMRWEMWPDRREDHGCEIADFFATMRAQPAAVLVAEGADGHLVAVAELSDPDGLTVASRAPSGIGRGTLHRP